MKKFLLLCLLVCATSAFGQTSGSKQYVTAIAGPGNIVKVIPFAPVTVCAWPPTGPIPCTNFATTFTDPLQGTACPSTAQVVSPGTNVCSATSDVEGNFAFFVSAPSTIAYYFQYLNQWKGPFIQVFPSGGASANFASPPPFGNVTPNTVSATVLTATGGGSLAGLFTGNPSFSGTLALGNGSHTATFTPDASGNVNLTFNSGGVFSSGGGFSGVIGGAGATPAAGTFTGLSFPAGLGGVSHILGPTDQPLKLGTQSNQNLLCVPNGTGKCAISAGAYIDALAFKSSSNCTIGTNDDACIQAALATVSSASGATIDLSSYGNVTTATNLFAPLQTGVQPSSAPKCITWLLSATQTLTTNGPWLVPTCNHVQVIPNRWAINGGGPIIIPGPSFPPCWGFAQPCNTAVETATVTTSASNCANATCVMSVTPTSGTPFTSSMLWSHFGVCTSSTGSWGGACVASGTQTVSGTTVTATAGAFTTGSAWNGLAITLNGTGCTISSVTDATHLTLTGACGSNGSWTVLPASPNNSCGANGQGSGTGPCLAFGAIIGVNINSALPNGCGSANCLLVAVPGTGSGLYGSGGSGPANATGVNYVIWAPVVTLGDFNATNINMGVQWEGGSIQTGSTQNISTGGASPIACANYNAQEESYFRFVQCLPQGTGKGVGVDIEGGSFNSGPYDNMIVTFPNNCNTATGQGSGNPLALVFRQNANASWPRPFMDTTITTSGCNSGAGFSPAVDWESPSILGPGIHVESGSGNNTLVDVSDPAIACPVFCPMIQTNSQGTFIWDINQTVMGASGIIVKIASGANQGGYTVEKIRGNNGTLLNDTNTGCVITQAAEKQLGVYATAPGTSASAPIITLSSSTTPGCQPQSLLTPAVVGAGGYTNSTTTFTSVTGLKTVIPASANTKLTCYVTYINATGTSGLKYQFTGPASPTAVITTLASPTSASAVANNSTSTTAFNAAGGTTCSGDCVQQSNAVTTNTQFTDVVTMSALNGTTAGTVQLQAALFSASGSAAIQPGSYCQ